MKKALGLAMVVLFAVACSSSGKSMKPITMGSGEKTSAKGVVTKTSALKDLKTNAKDTNALGALGGVFGDANVLVGKVYSSKASSGSIPGYLTDPKADNLDTCITTSGTKTTYNNCSVSASGVSETINGTFDVNGDTFNVDLKITTDYSGQKYDMTYKGSITVTATAVSGSLDLGVAMDANGSKTNYTLSIDYTGITLDATGCPTAGTMAIDSTTKATVSGYSAGYSVSLVVTFGPACGDVSMIGG